MLSMRPSLASTAFKRIPVDPVGSGKLKQQSGMLFLNLGDFGHGVDHLAKRAFDIALPPLQNIEPPLDAI